MSSSPPDNVLITIISGIAGVAIAVVTGGCAVWKAWIDARKIAPSQFIVIHDEPHIQSPDWPEEPRTSPHIRPVPAPIDPPRDEFF